VLEVARAGKAAVRLPIVLEGGRLAQVALQLPLARSIPPGFIYVPAGAFLYGSAGGADVRTVYGSQPIHRVLTGAYLIAMHETTYGEWIAFLRELPDSQRADRTPSVEKQGYTIKLVEQPDDHYQLSLGETPVRYTVREGEDIHYADRTTRAAQHWSRLPVSAVSFHDVEAYTAWLRDTGRVPNARPCTEHEWERAARGADGRAFPAGSELGPDDANVDVTYGRQIAAFGPDEVGSHPGSTSPFGLEDAAGNVWEWTASNGDPGVPVARGGGFFQNASLGRPEQRSEDIADRRDPFYGVRVCADPVNTDNEK
jgi:formylglycine-generating enzyme required for sulfatase activity